MSRSNPRRPRRRRHPPSAESLETRRLLAGGPDRLVNNNLGSTTSSQFTQAGAVLVAFGNTVVTAFNDSGSLSGGANKFTGFARSTNGGTSFTDGGALPTHTAGDAGFPSIARDDTTGRIYLATLSFTGNQPIQVFRSDTGGASWAAPVLGTPPAGNTEDKAWLTVDNFTGIGRGSVYLVTNRSTGAAPGIHLYRSTDAGNTFAPPGAAPVTTAAAATGAFVTVGPDHAVYVFWLEGTMIRMRRSADGGATFGAVVNVATGIAGSGATADLGLTGIRNGLATAAAFRTNAFPQVAVHPVNGNLYVTFANNPAGADKADVFLTQSTNAGTSWSVPVRVNDDATTTDQWFPTIAVTPNGSQLGVFYYSRQEDSGGNNLFRYHSRIATLTGTSTTTFGASSPVSDVVSLPEFGRDSVTNAQFVGDYNQAVATNDFFHVVWSDNRSDLLGGAPRKDPSIFYDKIPLAAAPTVIASNFNFATLPQRLSFTFDQDVTPSISIEDLVVQQLPAGPTFVPNGIGYNFVTNTVTYQFGTPLPDGRFRARLIAGGITNSAGTPMAADHVFEFTFLRGDANGDARVNLQDFNILAGNFGQSPRDFTQGDFNYDNTVNLQDFNILAGRFGVSVAPSAAGPWPGAGASDLDDDELTDILG